MDRYKWVFRENGGTGNADNIAGKLFLNDYAPLVRESIQNSLDAARSKTDPVKVVYRFGKIAVSERSSFMELEKWVDGGMKKFPNENSRTYKNLRNIKETLYKIKQSGVIHYLEVSDENTIGMDYSSDKHKQSGTRFYSFAKSVGNSSKLTATSAGSHGVGKVVFMKRSKINTIFVSSKSEDDGAEYFEGISELCTSLIGDSEYEYRGYFCIDESQEPTTDHNLIPELFRRHAFGTSVYVMGVTDDEGEQKKHMREIEKAVVDNFWLSVLHGKLTVQIGDTIIDKETVIDLAEKVYNNPELYDIRNSPDIRKYIEAVWFANTDNKHIYLTDDTIPELGKVHLYIYKNKQGENCIQCMRETRMLIKTEKKPNYGFYGGFVCDGEMGNKNLRNSENAEHNQWNSSECEEENDRINARRAIKGLNKFVNDQLTQIFGGNSTGKSDISGAEEFLFTNVASDEIEDPEMEVVIGKPRGGEMQDEVSPIQMTLFEDTEITQPKRERHGHVIIEKTDTASSDEDGDFEGGKTDTPHNPSPGPEPPPRPNDSQHYSHDEEGPAGHFIKPIRVKYRPFFQKEKRNRSHCC